MTTYTDITQQIFSLRKHLKMMQIVKSDDLSLQDCMQAQEINDNKMDPKFDISPKHTIAYKIKNQQVKLPQQLIIKQVAQVLANVLQLQAVTLSNRTQPLCSSIYAFSYLYDRSIVKNSQLFNAIVESVNILGAHIYQTTKSASQIKEDDVTVSTFSFSRNLKSHDEVAELLLQAQKKYQIQAKKTEDAQQKIYYSFILNVIRMRRSFHSLAKNLGIIYDPKNSKKIETDLQGTLKKLKVLEQTKVQLSADLLPSVFFDDLQKTLRVHFGPKTIVLTSLEQSLKQFKNAIVQIQLFFPVVTKITQLKTKIQILESKPYNSWSKSYIKSSIFAKQNYLFSTVKTQSAIIADIDDWVHLKQQVKNHQKFKKLMETSAPIISETLFRLLGNKMRWFYECSKIYEDYNVIIHMANQVDSSALQVKDFYAASWYYYYQLELMSGQLLAGFECNIYQINQIKYVLFVLQNILGITARNVQVFLKKIDKNILPQYNQGNLNKKLKKKLTDNQKTMFANIMFKSGLHTYIRALFNIITILHNRKLLQNKFEQTEQIRIKNRFRIFKNVMTIRAIDYQQYKKTIDQISKRQTQFLNKTLQQLKEVKTTFDLFTKQFEEGETFFMQREDAELLKKLSVKASLVVMTLKMGMPKKFGVDLKGKYPDLTME